MLPDGRRLGAHLPLGTGMVKAVDRAHEIGASALQIFGDNPTAWRRRAAPPAEQPAFRTRLAEFDIRPIAIHASYLINLAGANPTFAAQSVDLLADELRAAPGYGATLVNVHTGSHRGTTAAEGIDRLADAVAAILAEVEDAPDAARLVLENSAGSGFAVGATVDELSDIADAIAARGVPERRLAFCLDTAHLWGAGHDLADPDATDALLDAFDRRIGLRRLAMMHLNDSRAPLGSRLDRHEHIAAGGIGERGMAHLLTHPLLAGVPTYLETPGMDEGYDAINLARAHALARGLTLEPLPPGASSVRGGRARAAPHAEPEPV
jgi:deoxyribonuclease-4